MGKMMTIIDRKKEVFKEESKKIEEINEAEETAMVEFELQLFRLFTGFTRWSEECEKTANHSELPGHGILILHIIRMKAEPKSLLDIVKLLNKQDSSNINYTIKKLIEMGFIIKAKNTSKITKTARYEIAESSIQNADNANKCADLNCSSSHFELSCKTEPGFLHSLHDLRRASFFFYAELYITGVMRSLILCGVAA